MIMNKCRRQYFLWNHSFICSGNHFCKIAAHNKTKLEVCQMYITIIINTSPMTLNRIFMEFG